MIALSIVSHSQTDLVNDLLSDLMLSPTGSFDLLVLTLNTAAEAEPTLWSTETPWRKILIRNSIEKGFGANHNYAFRQAFKESSGPSSDDIWLVINPDIRIPDRNLIQNLKRTLDAGFVLVGPQVIENSRVAPSARGLYTPYQAARGLFGLSRNFTADPAWLAGMFLMIRATNFALLGGFDERYFMYCEDVDLSLRVQNIGGQIGYDQDCQVIHLAQRDSHRSLRALGRHLKSAIRLWTSSSFWKYAHNRRASNQR
jgi:N-acetylglucosaminyl-diphospho-decaprenol L-rhamnosyltransferase